MDPDAGWVAPSALLVINTTSRALHHHHAHFHGRASMPALDGLCGRHEDDAGFGNVAGQLLMRRHKPDVNEARDF